MSSYEDLLKKGLEEVPDDQDQGARFEVPTVDTRKSGSKTILPNFSKIADTFNRDEKPVKALIGELGTAGHVDSGLDQSPSRNSRREVKNPTLSGLK